MIRQSESGELASAVTRYDAFNFLWHSLGFFRLGETVTTCENP
jgi:hypothetical protein